MESPLRVSKKLENFAEEKIERSPTSECSAHVRGKKKESSTAEATQGTFRRGFALVNKRCSLNGSTYLLIDLNDLQFALH